ncbi:MAG: HEAT repeat domain-containing protein [Leptospiraceae bacterium]|nr:HEAT repeat domain-containing protein [Leptospiraceae bacterium]
MKRSLVVILIFLTSFVHLRAENPVLQEAIRRNQKLYDDAVRDLQRGDAHEKARAAIFLGGQSNSRYARVLGVELLRDLDVNSDKVYWSQNHPYVKSHIAWALGRISHPFGLKYLLEALDKTAAIIEKEGDRYRQQHQAAVQALEEARNARNQNSNSDNEPVREIVIEPIRPGPFLRSTENGLPYNPDIYWSLSNDFKHDIAPAEYDPVVAIRQRGYNYVNLMFFLFDSIGEIYYQDVHHTLVTTEDVNRIGAYLKHRFPFIRGAAALALGKIATPEALALIETAYEQEDAPANRARMSYAMLVNDKTQTKHFLNLLTMLRDDDDDVRYVVSVAFRDMGMSEAIDALKTAIELEHVPVIRENLRTGLDNAYRDLWRPTPQ